MWLRVSALPKPVLYPGGINIKPPFEMGVNDLDSYFYADSEGELYVCFYRTIR